MNVLWRWFICSSKFMRGAQINSRLMDGWFKIEVISSDSENNFQKGSIIFLSYILLIFWRVKWERKSTTILNKLNRCFLSCDIISHFEKSHVGGPVNLKLILSHITTSLNWTGALNFLRNKEVFKKANI